VCTFFKNKKLVFKTYLRQFAELKLCLKLVLIYVLIILIFLFVFKNETANFDENPVTNW
jgi:hypothetical protein